MRLEAEISERRWFKKPREVMMKAMITERKVQVRLSVCVCVCVFAHALSHILLFATPWTVACLAPLSMEFSRQEYRVG